MNENPLDQLKAIHTPDGVSYWPLAWGWWALIALSLAIIIFCGVYWYRRRQHLSAKRQALTALSQIDLSSAQAIIQCNSLMKRVALHYDNQPTVAGLYGEQWQHYLLSSLSPQFASQCEAIFAQAQSQAYQAESPAPEHTRAMQQATAVWIKHTQLCRFSMLSDRGGMKHV